MGDYDAKNATKTCAQCGNPFPLRHGSGRKRVYCSDACRVAHHARSTPKVSRPPKPRPGARPKSEDRLADEFFRGHPIYDIRRVLGLSGDELTRWREARLKEYRRAIS